MAMLKPYYYKTKIEAGCDEAGRGCLAGPVFAAAVILPRKFKNSILDDSKKLKEKDRYELREIIELEALAWSVAQVDQQEIDKINILQASFRAMHLAIDALSKTPNHLLIDGPRFVPYQHIKHTCIIKGDGEYASIAAASILAKTYRDDYMMALDVQYPHYDWKNNKGYGTKKHIEAIDHYGRCSHHRASFVVNRQGKLFD